MIIYSNNYCTVLFTNYYSLQDKVNIGQCILTLKTIVQYVLTLKTICQFDIIKMALSWNIIIMLDILAYLFCAFEACS